MHTEKVRQNQQITAIHLLNDNLRVLLTLQLATSSRRGRHKRHLVVNDSRRLERILLNQDGNNLKGFMCCVAWRAIARIARRAGILILFRVGRLLQKKQMACMGMCSSRPNYDDDRLLHPRCTENFLTLHADRTSSVLEPLRFLSLQGR